MASKQLDEARYFVPVDPHAGCIDLIVRNLSPASQIGDDSTMLPLSTLERSQKLSLSGLSLGASTIDLQVNPQCP